MSKYQKLRDEIEAFNTIISRLESLRDAKQQELDTMPTEEMVVNNF